MPEIKLEKRYKYAGDIMPKLLEIGFDLETACDFLNSIKDAYVAPKSAWISVDERLPEETCECLVIDAVGVIYLVKYSGRYRAFNAIDCDDGDRWKLNNITHWMPMPEPPITDKPTQE